MPVTKADQQRYEQIRQRFNWGYWDAVADCSRSTPHRWAETAHGDSVYHAGYCLGYRYTAAGISGTSSNRAWSEAVNSGSVTL